ncbi:YbhB/YbcL family Raf kinase inhibitor-like protein [Levilactobacillus cerevisiae]|uniref:YbhB/YbcL family Raf kinase inhibitor-like protein n=1 Tax=Levilactobacillus cerevisiae TaxID=1704076 RepID=UPI000F77956B|nr:YbhB/YbcL family Raf kinase inhibitor-like protein [Levilactobacillus cerevisiae]
MEIQVALDQGYLPEKFARLATARLSGQPIVSFPIQLAKLPKQTQALAITLIDYDAVPRTGFPFIHWLAVDLPVMTEITTDFSRHYTGAQGRNSWVSRFYDVDEVLTTGFAGPNPPDKPHRYTLTVYALKQVTGLATGFFYNDLRDALVSKVLDQATVVIPVKN